jgi:hypothetical protein
MLNLNKHYILYTEMMKPQSLLHVCHEPRPTVKGKSIFSSSVMEKRTGNRKLLGYGSAIHVHFLQHGCAASLQHCVDTQWIL